MKIKIIILSLFLLLLISCTSTKHTFYYNSSMNMIENKNMHFIQITLNNKKALLLIDTGASKSLLDISQAKKFDFEYYLIAKDHYIGIGGEQDIFAIYKYNISELFIPFLGTNLNNINTYFKKDNTPIIGVIGADFMEKFKTKIDFETNKMYYTVTILNE